MEKPAHVAVEVRRLAAAPHITWSETPLAQLDNSARALADAEWKRIELENPRVYDGGIALVSSVEEDQTIRCVRGSYKGFVTAPAAGIRAEALGVTGVLRHRRSDGKFVTLMGKRGRETRIYGGMWETAPRGTVPPPLLGVQLTARMLEEQLRAEMKEEVGYEIPSTHMTPYAVVRDPLARSLDVVYVAGIDARGFEAIEAAARRGGNWEYDALRWVDFEADGPRMLEELSPPTAALLRALEVWR